MPLSQTIIQGSEDLEPLKIFEIDPYLRPYAQNIYSRKRRFDLAMRTLRSRHEQLKEFANGHLFFGFHRLMNGWIYREWAPNASSLSLVGDFNGWNRTTHLLKKIGNGSWEVFIQTIPMSPV